MEQQRVQGDAYQMTLVCVDRYENGVPQGRFYNAAQSGGVEFHSLMEFLRKMEALLDGMQYPQAFVSMRSFGESQTESERSGEPLKPQHQEGECATFTVRVLFRQNASWQGRVSWLEGGKETTFRSALELVFLMDSAMRQNQ